MKKLRINRQNLTVEIWKRVGVETLKTVSRKTMTQIHRQSNKILPQYYYPISRFDGFEGIFENIHTHVRKLEKTKIAYTTVSLELGEHINRVAEECNITRPEAIRQIIKEHKDRSSTESNRAYRQKAYKGRTK